MWNTKWIDLGIVYMYIVNIMLDREIDRSIDGCMYR